MFSKNRFDGNRMKRSCAVLYLLMAVVAAQAEKVQPKQVEAIVPSYGKRGRTGEYSGVPGTSRPDGMQRSGD